MPVLGGGRADFCRRQRPSGGPTPARLRGAPGRRTTGDRRAPGRNRVGRSAAGRRVAVRITRSMATAFRRHTTVWFSYDADYLYFAFKCDDPEPAGIKTSITRRDNIWQDDWVGVSLDALGTGQLSYHMMVNPSGVQLDMLNSVGGQRGLGARLDLGQRRPRHRQRATSSRSACRCRASASRAAPTRAWASSSGAVSAGWASRWRGRRWLRECGCSNAMRSLRFDQLQPRLPRELLPSTTYARTETRESPARWTAADAGRCRLQRQGRPDLDDHAGRDGQSRFQPGGERRVSGGGQPALSDLLRREAPLLHGRHRHLRARRHGMATTACAPRSTRGGSSIRSSAPS